MANFNNITAIAVPALTGINGGAAFNANVHEDVSGSPYKRLFIVDSFAFDFGNDEGNSAAYPVYMQIERCPKVQGIPNAGPSGRRPSSPVNWGRLRSYTPVRCNAEGDKQPIIVDIRASVPAGAETYDRDRSKIALSLPRGFLSQEWEGSFLPMLLDWRFR